jgi:putative phosphoesterase
MRIALFSDVHGNLAGLRAVAAALEREEPVDYVVVAGDHLQGGPRPREVWSLLRSRGWVLVRGNEDEGLTVPSNEARAPERYRTAFAAQHAWTRARLGPEILQELADLPERWRVTTPAGDLLVVHASPRSIDDRYGGIHNTLAEITAVYGGTGAAVIAFGHYHLSFVRTTPFALLINVASVGLPLSGRPLASYTILTAMSDGFVVQQRQVPYRQSEEAAAARARGLPLWVPDGEPGERREEKEAGDAATY